MERSYSNVRKTLVCSRFTSTKPDLRSAVFESVSFWDRVHGCAVAPPDILFCTADSGRTWTSRRVLPKTDNAQVMVENSFKKIVFAAEGRRGLVLNFEGLLYTTEDGGNTWNRLQISGSEQKKH
jgi:photosystem II stability/assembly factor-like uncharacterized protein